MTTPRKNDKDPLVQMKEEILAIILKEYAHTQSDGHSYFHTEWAANMYHKLAALKQPTLGEMEGFLRTEARLFNVKCPDPSMHFTIDVTGYLAQCQAIQLQQVKKDTLLDLFRVDAAITILQSIHTIKRPRVGLKEALSDFAQEIVSGNKTPEQIVEYLKNDLSIGFDLTDKIRTLHKAYVENEKLFQSTKAAEIVAEPQKMQVSSSSTMWKEEEEQLFSKLESNCKAVLNDPTSKADKWKKKVNELKKDYNKFYELINSAEHPHAKIKGLKYKLHIIDKAMEDINIKMEKLDQDHSHGIKHKK